MTAIALFDPVAVAIGGRDYQVASVGATQVESCNDTAERNVTEC